MAKIVKIFCVISIIALLNLPHSHAQEKAADEKGQAPGMFEIVQDAKKTIIFIGTVEGKDKITFYATGFLVQVQGYYHLLTAKHVIADRNTGKLKDEDMYAFFNLKDGRMAARKIKELKKVSNADWIFHENAQVDIAILPFPIDLQTDDVKFVPENLFTSPDKIFELYDVFFLSYQPAGEFETKISPIFRVGAISSINDDKTFYVDAFAFPGNSGSPVFLKPSPIRFYKGGITMGKDFLGGTFIGIIGEYIPYQEVAVSAQTGRPRVMFEENTGLSKVWSVDYIKQILDSDSFKEQLNRIKKMTSPKKTASW
ncbi:MAG: serine protease [Candidatus Omnitrophota bacterium]|jgi:hypothetical protein